METIKNYLDNMFAGLPKTARITNLKNDILSNMEEKYNELKAQGKSENEAIGIVISEFGNIDELVNELGIRKEEGNTSKPIVNREEVEAYLQVKKTMGVQIGIGVILCIFAPATLILIYTLFGYHLDSISSSHEAGSILGVISMLILVALAVGIFIFTGINFDRYKYMEDGVQIPANIAAELKQRYDNYTPAFYFKIIIGVCLIILSPVSIFVTSLMGDAATQIGVVILLLIVAFSVFLFITTGTIRNGYECLLQIGDYSKKQQEQSKVISAVASIVWPIAVIIFLVSGLVYDMWHICWIVFPITGILFGMFSATYNTIKGTEQDK